jgi:Tfp pilus assembly PilM family ATPase
MKNNTCTIIEFSAYSLKLAQYLKKEKIITNLFIPEAPTDSKEGFIKALDKIIKTNHLKVSDLTISLERSFSSLRIAKLPPVTEEEIVQMAQWQAAKIFPLNFEQVTTSYKRIKIDRKDFAYVVLVAVPKNIIMKFLDICSVLRLTPQFISLSCEGLLQWYVQQNSGRDKHSAVALIEIDNNKIELVIIYENNLIFSRSLSLDLSGNENQTIRKSVAELQLSLALYKRQELSPTIDKIVLTGGSGYILKFSSALNSELNLPVEAMDYLRGFNAREDILKQELAPNISLASICGFIKTSGPPEINLIPQEIKDRLFYIKKKKEFLKTIYLSFFAILVIFLSASSNLYYKEKIITRLDKQILETGKAAEKISNIKNKILILDRHLGNQNSCLEVLKEIHKAIAEGVYIDTFIFQEDSQVNLKGSAPGMPLILESVARLNESLVFREAQIKYVTQTKTEAGESTDFEIICKLAWPGQ